MAQDGANARFTTNSSLKALKANTQVTLNTTIESGFTIPFRSKITLKFLDSNSTPFSPTDKVDIQIKSAGAESTNSTEIEFNSQSNCYEGEYTLGPTEISSDCKICAVFTTTKPIAEYWQVSLEFSIN